MAKSPAPPKGKTAAPAQFDMNSRERKGGGRGGPGGRGRDREDKRPPSRIESLPPTLVDRGEGWTIQKIGKIDQASHTAVGAEYQLIFEGHDPIVFNFLGAARERAKEPPPEKPEPEAAAPEEVPSDSMEVDDAAATTSEDAAATEEPAESP